MPALRDAKREKFAVELAKGTARGDAYALAGFKPNAQNASRMANRLEIMARVEELRLPGVVISERIIEKTAEKIATKEAASREWVIDRLIENVERAMQLRSVVGPDGKETGEYKYDGAVANRALELLGKEIGMFIERRESLNVNYSITDKPLTSEEWAERHTDRVVAPAGPSERTH